MTARQNASVDPRVDAMRRVAAFFFLGRPSRRCVKTISLSAAGVARAARPSRKGLVAWLPSHTRPITYDWFGEIRTHTRVDSKAFIILRTFI